MGRAVASSFLLLFTFFFFCCHRFSEAKSTNPEPQEFRSFKINNTIQSVANSCSYRVVITTSCSSTTYTRDQISLSFGDAYGNQVYAPGLDDPSSGAFERCSTDTYQISGPCTYPICYLYLYRSGRDGWRPQSVVVYPPSYQAVSFYYDTWIPNGVWYGFNYCNGGSSLSGSATAAAVTAAAAAAVAAAAME